MRKIFTETGDRQDRGAAIICRASNIRNAGQYRQVWSAFAQYELQCYTAKQPDSVADRRQMLVLSYIAANTATFRQYVL